MHNNMAIKEYLKETEVGKYTPKTLRGIAITSVSFCVFARVRA